ncbi:hypothetical protein [Arsenicicoccus piscis]|uniref:hypothetical protein n=1 Tax=Arsenicicoccus piscis TaxID=673954 RepID=UPI0024E11EB8|nr:hypothetical protein [Arsenicicoccus piscis]
MPPGLAGLYGPPDGMWAANVLTDVAGAPLSTIILGPVDTCRSLTLTTGRCPKASFEILVSEADAKRRGWRPGTEIRAREGCSPASPAQQAFTSPFVVVGSYQFRPDPAHWGGLQLDQRSGLVALDSAGTLLADAWVTTPQTFDQPWRSAWLTLTRQLRPDQVDLDSYVRIPGLVEQTSTAALTLTPTPLVTTNLDESVARLAEGRRQAAVIIPLLLAQLVVLFVVVFALVTAALVEQRRPEVGLAKLRGRGSRGAAGLLARELGTLTLVGVVLGAWWRSGSRPLRGTPGCPTACRPSCPGPPSRHCSRPCWCLLSPSPTSCDRCSPSPCRTCCGGSAPARAAGGSASGTPSSWRSPSPGW